MLHLLHKTGLWVAVLTFIVMVFLLASHLVTGEQVLSEIARVFAFISGGGTSVAWLAFVVEEG